MNNRDSLPMMLSASDIQSMGFTRSMVYEILKMEDVPVVRIGKRKFIEKDKFFKWLEGKEIKLEKNGKDGNHGNRV